MSTKEQTPTEMPAATVSLESSLSFSDFLHEALYHPERGYYATGRARIGKEGDFFTNVSVGPVYGKILSLVMEELWERFGEPDPFFIVEQGANDGRLACDILEAIYKKENGSFSKSVHYLIVEPFPALQQQQQATLKNVKNVSWVADIQELPAFEGIYFSNELVDAFPFDLLRWNGERWLEQRVVRSEGSSFSWTIEPIRNPALQRVAKKLPTTLPTNFVWEARLGIHPWLKSIAERLQRGMLLIADYGYSGADRFAPYRAQGSIACYEQHRRYDNPLEKIGERDITAHVDFTDLSEAALEAGWELLGFTDQHHFLIRAAEKWLRSLEEKTSDVDTRLLSKLATGDEGQGASARRPAVYKEALEDTSTKATPPFASAVEFRKKSTQKIMRGFQTLIHPETMGRSFQFLGLGKKMEVMPPLSGFCQS